MPPRNRPSLSLSPEALEFVGEAPSEPRSPIVVEALEAPEAAPEAAPKAKPRAKAARAPAERPSPPEPARHEAPPAKHRVLRSGKLTRCVTGFVPPELGERLDAYLEAEERTVSWVLARALDEWLAKRA